MQMAKEERTSQPHTGRRSRSPSLSRSRRSRSRSSDSEEASNPGNNLYVTGLSTRVTETDLEKFFNREGKVVECHLVRDPHSKESRGFAFVTMETNKDAQNCVDNLNRSVLEGRLVTVEKAKRRRGRTPTPGQYQGLRDKRVIGAGEDLVVTHRGGDTIEILIVGNGECGGGPLMAGGQVMIAIGGIGTVPSLHSLVAS